MWQTLFAMGFLPWLFTACATLFTVGDVALTVHPIEVDQPVTQIMFYEALAGDRAGTLDGTMNNRVSFYLNVRNIDPNIHALWAILAFAENPSSDVEAVRLLDGDYKVNTSNPQIIAKAKEGRLNLVITLMASRVPTLDAAFRNVSAEWISALFSEVRSKITGESPVATGPVYYYVQTTKGAVSVLRMPIGVIFPPTMFASGSDRDTSPWPSGVARPKGPAIAVKSGGTLVRIGCSLSEEGKSNFQRAAEKVPGQVLVFSLEYALISRGGSFDCVAGDEYFGSPDRATFKISGGPRIERSPFGGWFYPSYPDIPQKSRTDVWVPAYGSPLSEGE